MNEENGSRGGLAYAADHKSEIPNHFAAIETDLGAGHPLGFYAQGKPEILTLLQPLAVILQSQGAGVTRLVEETGSDIGPLGAAGVPTLSPNPGSGTYFHSPPTGARTPGKVNSKKLQGN